MKRLMYLALMLCIGQISFAQNLRNEGPIAKQVATLKSQGATFTNIDVLQPTTLPAAKNQSFVSLLPNARYYSVDVSTVTQLMKAKPNTMSLTLATSTGDITLDMYRVDLLSADFQAIGSNTGAPVQYTAGAYYRGVDADDPLNIASISIFENEIRGVIYQDGGNIVLGKINDQSLNGTHILYNDANLQGQHNRECHTPELPVTYTEKDLANNGGSMKAGDCVKIYLEAGSDVHDAAGSLNGTINWVTGMWNECATLYTNESINTSLNEIYVHQSKDPYKGNSASWFLSQFQSQSAGYNGDIGMLLKLKNVGGIAASIGGICTGSSQDGMAFSGIQGSYAAVPTYSWDVALVTHEFGHIFNSRHTHACVWNGNNTAIDGCAGGTEGSCPNPGLPSGGGTIMSYCDNTSVGINFNLGFGSQPGNVIRNYVASMNCLASSCGGTNTCNNGVQDGNETGVDCGGSCPPCGTCTNGVQDGDETGVDCGGSCPACPTCSDGIQNGNETGVDCGGSCPPCQTSCTAPGGQKATGIKPKRANLTWNSVSGANDYTAELRATGASSWTAGNTSGTSITATGLTSGQQYEWRVTANCSGGSATSGICLFTAGDKNSGACGAPKFTSEFSVYPNPATSTLHVIAPFNEGGEFTMIVTDMLGKVMINEQVQPGEEWQIDMRAYPVGMYVVSLRQSDGNTFTSKIVKE